MKHVADKAALRKSLMEKKEIAAKQFFELVQTELAKIESGFWEDFKKEQCDELLLRSKLEQFYDIMNV
jgi:hypothetical protein